MSTALDPHPTFLRDFAETRGFGAGHPSRIQVAPDGCAVLFLRSAARDPVLSLFEFDVAAGTTRELWSPREDVSADLADQLSGAQKARRERQRVTESGFTSFSLSLDGAHVLLPLAGRLLLLERATGRKRMLFESPGPAVQDARFSPGGKYVAFVLGYDLWLVPVGEGAGAARALTHGGTEDVMYGLPEFVAQEEMARFEGYWWSPDGARIAFAEVDEREVERLFIADPFRPDRPPATARYPRAGKSNAGVRLGVLNVADGPATPAPTWIDWDCEKYPYLARVLWDVAGAPPCALVQTRDQHEVALLAVDPTTGGAVPLVTEEDPAWVNLDRDLPRWLPDGSGFLWASEGSGRRELELRRADGTLSSVVVPGAAGFLSLVHVSPSAAEALVLLGDATTNYLARVSLNGGSLTALLPPGQAEHAVSVARGGDAFVDTCVAAAALPESTVHGADGVALGRLPSLAEIPPFRVNLELTTVAAADDARVFHVAIVRPRAFDPARRYPVVVNVYGGPHSLMVKSDERHYLMAQWIADHGAIVVFTDNRGTPRRDRAWERAIKGSFSGVPLDDQVAALTALGNRFAEMDLSRVGIHGWSFGGFMAALAVMKRPDVFHVAVAGAPVADWRDYDTHYTERYLGLPDRNAEGYRSSSLLTHAPTLARPLLLIYGTADDNVYAFHSLKLAGALLRAGRSFELLPLPGVTHQIADPLIKERLWGRITSFLLSKLL